MKYLSTFLTIILAWLLLDEFVLKHNEVGKKYSIVDRWKELGKNSCCYRDNGGSYSSCLHDKADYPFLLVGLSLGAAEYQALVRPGS